MKRVIGGALAAAVSLGAQTPPPVDWGAPSSLPRLAWEDTRWVFTAPGRWDGRDWALAGLGLAAVVGAYSLDGRVDEAVVRHRSTGADDAARKLEGFGGVPGLVLVGGAYAYGHFAEHPAVRNAAADAGMAVLITRLLFVLPLKEVTGRARPEEGLGSRHFEPFHGDSFPSGHTAQAFAMASVLSAHADRTWVSCVSFGAASLVGLARIEQRQHYLSDVVAGGLLGTAIGFGVAGRNLELRSKHKIQASFHPVFDGRGPRAAVALRF